MELLQKATKSFALSHNREGKKIKKEEQIYLILNRPWNLISNFKFINGILFTQIKLKTYSQDKYI